MSFSDIKVGTHIVLLQKYPCKVIEVKISKPGKHGGAKKLVIGLDVITDKRYEEIYRSCSVVTMPNVSKNMYQISATASKYL